MKKLKKSLSLLLALVMVLSCMSMSAFATDTVLPTAVDGVITLTSDVALNSVQVITTDTSINLNGYTLTAVETNEWKPVFKVTNGATLTIDGHTEGSKIEGTLQIPSNATGHIQLNGGTYTDDCYTPICVNGTANSDSTIEINDAVIVATDAKGYSTAYPHDNAEAGHALYIAGPATVTLNDCTITGTNTGIEIRAGVLNVNGTTQITGGSGDTQVTSNGNGSTTKNAAIAVAQHTTKKAITVNVNGGSLNANTALIVSNPENNPQSDFDKVSVSVNGGTFSDVNAVDYLANNYTGGVTIEIADAAGLKAFADKVNAGNNFAGVTVKLTGDTYDLSSYSWTPIGTTDGLSIDGNNGSPKSESTNKFFSGTFDGNGKSITGLTNNLFGATKNATIRDLTIDGATINTTRFAGALAGYAYNTAITNVDVTGALNISGTHFVGGALGYLAGSALVEDLDVNASGTVKAYDENGEDGDDVGGLVGYFGPSAKLEDCDVRGGLTVSAQRQGGGLVGLFSSATSITNCTVNNVTVECNTTTTTYTSESGGNAGKVAFGGMIGGFNDSGAKSVTGSVTNVNLTKSTNAVTSYTNGNNTTYAARVGFVSGGKYNGNDAYNSANISVTVASSHRDAALAPTSNMHVIDGGYVETVTVSTTVINTTNTAVSAAVTDIQTVAASNTAVMNTSVTGGSVTSKALTVAVKAVNTSDTDSSKLTSVVLDIKPTDGSATEAENGVSYTVTLPVPTALASSGETIWVNHAGEEKFERTVSSDNTVTVTVSHFSEFTESLEEPTIASSTVDANARLVLYTASLSLEDSININYYFYVPSGLDYSKVSGTISFNGTENNFVLDSENVRTDIVNGVTMYRVTLKMAARFMDLDSVITVKYDGSPVTFKQGVFTEASRNSKYTKVVDTVVNSLTYSAYDYLDWLEGDSDGYAEGTNAYQMNVLAKATRAYGEAAKAALGQN